MKIGVFDSGLGGLIVTKAFLDKLGEYDYVYLGDTKNLPYGEKEPKQVLEMTIKGMEFLIGQGASIIIIACNTASCVALRYLQRVYMPRFYPQVKVLGVIVPTVEEAVGCACSRGDLYPSPDLQLSKAQANLTSPAGGEVKSVVGVAATKSTVNSHIYRAEIQKIAPEVEVVEVATPELVPVIEAGNMDEAEVWVKRYADKLLRLCQTHPAPTGHPSEKQFLFFYPSHPPLKERGGEFDWGFDRHSRGELSSIILGCTHYPALKGLFRKYLPDSVRVISQDEFMSEKLADYLKRHPEIESVLSKNGLRDFFVTEIQPGNVEGAKRIVGDVGLELVDVY